MIPTQDRIGNFIFWTQMNADFKDSKFYKQ